MTRFHGTIVSSLVALGIAGAALAPTAGAATNNHAFEKSSAAQKLHESMCDSLYNALNSAVDKGLAASHAGNTADQKYYTAVAQVYMGAIQGNNCG